MFEILFKNKLIFLEDHEKFIFHSPQKLISKLLGLVYSHYQNYQKFVTTTFQQQIHALYFVAFMFEGCEGV